MDVSQIMELFFDFDGVFVDLFKLYVAELIAVAASLGMQKPQMEEIKKHWGEGIETFLGNIMPGISVDVFFQRSRELGFRGSPPPRIMGVRRKLALLANYYPLSIISNRTQPSLGRIMEELEIESRLFCFIQSGSDIPRHFHKPSPKIFRERILFLFSAGIYPENILYVGDNEIDFLAANGAGLQFVGVTSCGPTTREDFTRVGVPKNHIMDSIRDLPNFLGIPER